ncbi:spore germination protein GerW family protein [Streptomyces sp. CAU 1734]|uniref:spore germination protein GerW family protein n=1 Tax=Streptomyces sp. CAU 1734 TaxID=3140360 RepID=UPI0032618D8B
MNEPEQTPRGEVEADSARAVTEMLERLAGRLGGGASAAAVFGEPVTGGGVTVIPVARARMALGGGAGREARGTGTGEGGGGGGAAEAKPLGFIEISGGSAVYRPIRDPWAVAVPLAALLVGAVAGTAAGALAGRRNRPGGPLRLILAARAVRRRKR